MKCSVCGKATRTISARESTFERCPQHHFFNEDGKQVHDPTNPRLVNAGQPVSKGAAKKKPARKRAAAKKKK